MKYEIWSNMTNATGGVPEEVVAQGPYIPFFSDYVPGCKMEKTWEGEIRPQPDLPTYWQASYLDRLFAEFNHPDRPNGAVAHSLSCGDVIVLNGEAFSVSQSGFKKLEEFRP